MSLKGSTDDSKLKESSKGFIRMFHSQLDGSCLCSTFLRSDSVDSDATIVIDCRSNEIESSCDVRHLSFGQCDDASLLVP